MCIHFSLSIDSRIFVIFRTITNHFNNNIFFLFRSIDPLFRFVICSTTKKSLYSYTFDKLSNKLYIKYKKIFGKYYLEEEDLANIKKIEIHQTSNDQGHTHLDAKLVLNTNKKLPLVLYGDSIISRKIVIKINQFLDIGIYEW